MSPQTKSGKPFYDNLDLDEDFAYDQDEDDREVLDVFTALLDEEA